MTAGKVNQRIRFVKWLSEDLQEASRNFGSSTNRVREFARNQTLLIVGFRGASCDSPRSGFKNYTARG